MFGFIKRLFDRQAPTLINDDPFGRDIRPLPPAAPAPAAPLRETSPAFLQRDEIIDAKTRIAGYRFTARMPDLRDRPDAHTANELLRESRIATFASRRLALIPLLLEHLFDVDFRPLIGEHTVFLPELPESPEQAEQWRAVIGALRLSGARIAMNSVDAPTYRSLIGEDADLLLVDFSAYALSGFERTIESLRHERPERALIAENIQSWPEFRLCLSLGLAYCIGSFATTQDEANQSEEINQSRLVLIEMLNLLRQDADLPEVAKVAKRDPGVALKLVAMANSPILALSQSVASIDQAIMILGREQLYRWLSMAMFRAGTGSPRDEVLLEIALSRGRFLELIGRCHHQQAECNELFLVGLLSLLDCLLGVPMAKVVERLNLSNEIKAVLLHSDGPMGRYLMLAIATEKGHAEGVSRLADLLHISLNDIEKASTDALAWAEEAVRQ